jgi:hypothetical protein
MKKIIRISVLLLLCIRVYAQSQELQQLKLDLEKLAQFKLILSQMKQGYQVLQNGYNAVRDAAKGNFELHKQYLDGLMRVNPSIHQSSALQQMYLDQSAMETLYQEASRQFLASGLFSSSELKSFTNNYHDYMARVHDDLDMVSVVMRPGELRMNDAERLQVLGVSGSDVAAQQGLLQKMINQYQRLLAMRLQQRKDNLILRKLSGLK